MEKSITTLDLNRPQWQAPCCEGLPLQNTSGLKEKLLGEIALLDQQMSELEFVSGSTDFSMQQTCREMIHSRKLLYNQLTR